MPSQVPSQWHGPWVNVAMQCDGYEQTGQPSKVEQWLTHFPQAVPSLHQQASAMHWFLLHWYGPGHPAR